MALERRQPAAGLLHHADRGSQYACQAPTNGSRTTQGYAVV